MYRYSNGKLYEINHRQASYAEFYEFKNDVDLKRLAQLDEYAQKDIQDCLDIIEAVKEYRQDLAAYVQNLLQIQPTLELRLIREAHWQGKKFYNVGIYEIYPNGEKQTIFQRFKGTERKQAFELFEQLQKQYPGIKTVKDIDKRSWER